MEKTFVIKGQPESNWILVDADGQNVGRMCTKIAGYLLGKHKPTFTPGVAVGDHVVVINASKLEISEKDLFNKKYYRHSNYPGGLKTVTMKDQLEKHPDRIIRDAVWGMIPHNKLGREIIKNLKVYAGSEHPHSAQNPQVVTEAGAK